MRHSPWRRVPSVHALCAWVAAPALLALVSLVGCDEGPDGSGQEPHTLPSDLGEDGKYDNYVSSNAREFELVGAAHVNLP